MASSLACPGLRVLHALRFTWNIGQSGKHLRQAARTTLAAKRRTWGAVKLPWPWLAVEQRFAPSGQILADPRGTFPSQSSSKGVTLGGVHSLVITMSNKGRFQVRHYGCETGHCGVTGTWGLAREASATLCSLLLGMSPEGMSGAFK